ncbi:MAG: sigma-E processing peptidase SpoIIGA [Clostridiales bacterium]|jgi:stage II sporulation protein GA (sporulation sigma-E factor processing peptidase)|nr:sigma-E processing peptidase SpoIIGA [Clostridiales bacterium]
MREEVYADLLFLINFSMDFLCLYLTARFLRRRMRLVLITSAATVGGVYSVVSLFLPFGKIELFLCDIAVCALICTIAFHSLNKAVGQFVKEVVIYLLISMTLGGIMTALFNLLNRLDLPLQQGGDSISSWLFLLLAIISGLTALGSGNILKRMSARRMLTVKIEFEKRSVTLTGMTDTGNILRDPASGKPVIITDIKSTLPILPDPIRQAAIAGRVDKLTEIPVKYSNRIRIIPSETVSGKRLLLGVVPDKIILSGERGESDVSALFAPMPLPSLPEGCSAIIPGELNI